jgi:arginase
MDVVSKVGILGVPYNVGWKGEGIDKGPQALRNAGLAERLGKVACVVTDLGDIQADLPPYDDSNPKLLNPRQVVALCRVLASRVEKMCRDGYFPLILGGEDSVLMGIIEGLKRGLKKRIGLIYFDAHGDFNTPETTPSGLIGGMNVAVVAGRGTEMLTKMFGYAPQLPEENIALFGVRDLDPPEKIALKDSRVHLYSRAKIRELGIEAAMNDALGRLQTACDQVYIHVDLDVLDEDAMKAQILPVLDGLSLSETSSAIRMARATGKLQGIAIMVFNPLKDPEGLEARKVTELISEAMSPERV